MILFPVNDDSDQSALDETAQGIWSRLNNILAGLKTTWTNCKLTTRTWTSCKLTLCESKKVIIQNFNQEHIFTLIEV